MTYSVKSTGKKYQIIEVDFDRYDLPGLWKLHEFRTGAEIGVWRGDFANHILRRCDTNLYLIDPWQGNIEGYNDIRNQSQEEQERCYQATLINMSAFPGRYTIIRDFSHRAVKQFDDGQLDFVYLDADHELIWEDLNLWYPKVRHGGMVAGHDFLDGDNVAGSNFKVKTAVTQFVGKIGVKRIFKTSEHDWPSWYFWKGASSG